MVVIGLGAAACLGVGDGGPRDVRQQPPKRGGPGTCAAEIIAVHVGDEPAWPGKDEGQFHVCVDDHVVVKASSSDGTYRWNGGACEPTLDPGVYRTTFTAAGVYTISVACADGGDGDAVRVAASTVIGIEYLPTGRGTTGDLSSDNPDGGLGPPDFSGGFRFFPGAETFDTRTVSRNIVRVRATVQPAIEGVPVHFRAFDVDDPSVDPAIDPDGNGRDNRGTLNAALDMPDHSHAPDGTGYRGRLRPVGAAAFAAEGAVVTVDSRLQDGTAIAEVDLATTFAPGDNFRVVASCGRAEVAALNETTDVPTTGPIAGFMGMVTDQLSIWRRVHVEQDRMATTEGDRQAGRVTGAIPRAASMFDFVTDVNVFGANEYEGGFLRVLGQNIPILANTGGANSVFTVVAPAALVGVDATVFQDDWIAAGNDAPVTRVDTALDDNVYDFLQESPIRAQNRFADAYIQPELDTLDRFDTNDVPSTSHVLFSNRAIRVVFDDSRATRAAGSETDVFWVTYVGTAFESSRTLDNDPAPERAIYGATPSDRSQISIVLLETTRDFTAGGALSEAQARAVVAAHEIGHQFRIANTPNLHRAGGNLMRINPAGQALGSTLIDPNDVAFLRRRRTSP